MSEDQDQGGIDALLSLDLLRGLIKLDFGKSLSWVSMTPAEARAFAKALLLKADALDPQSKL